jgi:polyisoprenyl-phosphate glycosyltransferase
MKKKISVLIPIYNEVENIKNIYESIKLLFLSRLKNYDYEILFLDNASNDGSRDECLKIRKSDENTIYLRQSRNFGYQSNILTGYYHCDGDCAICIDADGQDDPELLISLIEKWEKGYDVVYGIRQDREENFFLKNTRKVFYRTLNYFSDFDIPADSGDFRLVNRKIIDLIKLTKENSLYLRGLISYFGYKQIGVKYKRKKRNIGKSKFNFSDNFNLAQIGILSFSKFPLKFITISGLAIFVFSLVGIFFYLSLFFIKGTAVAGFTTLILVLLFFFGIIIFFLGITALYIGQILDEVKNRPRFIIDEKK